MGSWEHFGILREFTALYQHFRPDSKSVKTAKQDARAESLLSLLELRWHFLPDSHQVPLWENGETEMRSLLRV